jgi:hypothetical protein
MFRIVRVAVLALLVAALPAAAETFTVTLNSGQSFTTRYEPQEASWDSNTILLLTDVGNWMAVSRADIEKITEETASKGFGLRINPTTIVFGWAPNDKPLPEEGGATQAAPSPFEQMLNRSYDLHQFVEPSDAGGGGLPVYNYGFSYSGGGGGGGGGGRAPSPAPVAPAPTPPSGSQ